MLFILQHVLRFLFPKFCLQCSLILETELIFCFSCLAKQTPPLAKELKITSEVTLKVYSAFYYEPPLTKIVKAKFGGRTELFVRAANTVSEMKDFFLPKGFFDQAILVPIPIHWTRKLLRGFNQAEVFASALAKQNNTKCSSFLIRTRMTKYQSLLSKDERWKNVKDCFSVDKNDLPNISAKIILIDDLLTSGSTLVAATKKLRSYGFNNISALTICKKPMFASPRSLNKEDN